MLSIFTIVTNSMLSNYTMTKITLAFLFFSLYLVPEVTGKALENAAGQNKLAVAGVEFHQGHDFDDGAIRVFLRNCSQNPVSVNSCNLEKLPVPTSLGQVQQKTLRVKCLFSRLDPPEILPGQTGEFLIKPRYSTSSKYPLRCSITTSNEEHISIDVPVQQPRLKIEYVAFSEDLSNIYVYVRNNSDHLMQMSVDEINDYVIKPLAKLPVHELSPNTSTCLIFSLKSPLKHGQYVYIRISGKNGDSTVSTNALTRVFGQFPLSCVGTRANTQLCLDSHDAWSEAATEALCVYGLECVCHAHGTIPEAASKFTHIRQIIITKHPDKLVTILFCWPKTDLRKFAPFFQLPDLPVINTCKYTYSSKSGAPHDYLTSFHPYYWRARQALIMSSPRPFAAVIPVGPDAKKRGFDISLPSIDYVRFMTYCAIAGGAKGVYYMMTSQEIEDPIRYQGFLRLNKELRALKPLLTISQPISTAQTDSADISATVLQCGSEALLVILLNKAYPGIPAIKDSNTPTCKRDNGLVKIEFPVSQGLRVTGVKDSYGHIPPSQWNLKKDRLAVSYNMTESATILRVEVEASDKTYYELR